MVWPRHPDDLRRRHAPRDRARARRRGHEARLGRIRRALVMSLYCVHGFLGGPWDWDFLADAGFDIAGRPFLFGTELLPLVDVAQTLNDTIPPDAVLVGYSMGGRLIAQALARAARPSKAALASTAPGIATPTPRPPPPPPH